jgi:hypothetical protein
VGFSTFTRTNTKDAEASDMEHHAMAEDEKMNQLRIDIWDHIYKSGPCSIAQIANHFRISYEEVQEAIVNDWFAVQDEVVSNATVS